MNVYDYKMEIEKLITKFKKDFDKLEKKYSPEDIMHSFIASVCFWAIDSNRRFKREYDKS